MLTFALVPSPLLTSPSRTRRPKRGPQFAFMEKLLLQMNQHPSSWAFTTPVNAAEVTDYYDVIKEPMGELQSLAAPSGRTLSTVG